MPLVFVPVVIFPFVFSKLIFFQILIGLTFPAYLILAWIEPQYRLRWSWLYTAFGAYFVALLISVIFAVDPIKAWWGNQERMNGLFTLLHFLAWMTMTVSVVKTWKQWKLLLNYQIFLGVFMACVCLLQLVYPNLLLFPASGRVGGLLDNPIYSGAYQLFVMFFIALLWFKTKNLGWRIWYVIAFIASLGAMFAAGSRGPFMGLFFGAFISAVTVGVLNKNKKIRIGVLSLAIFGVVFYVSMVLVGAKSKALYPIWHQFPEAQRLFSLDTGTAGRFIAWDIAWKGFLERPLTGWGLDDFHILFNTHYNPQSLRSGYGETWFDRAHNTVMDVVSMTGLLGFITFAAIWVLMYATIIKARRKGWIDIPTTAVLMGLPAGYFLQNLFVFDHPAAFSMSYLLYALVICIGYHEFSSEVPALKKTSVKSMPWVTFGIVQVVFIVLVYLTSVMPVYASYLTIKSNNYFSAGNFDQSLSLAKSAASIQTPYLDEQTFLQSRNLITLADGGKLQQWPAWKELFQLVQDINERYLVSHSMNTNSIFVYASVLESIGRATNDSQLLAKSEKEYQLAIATSPERQQLYYSYGRLLSELGRNNEALQQFQKAAGFDEAIGESWWYVGVTYWFNLGKPELGTPNIIKALKAKFPYALHSPQEALIAAQAYDSVNDKDSLKALITLLPTLPAGTVTTYIDIAKVMEHQGLIEQRNLILSAVIRLDPEFQHQMQGLIDGKAKTIDESIKMATSTPVVSQSSTLTSTPSVTTLSVPHSNGPRK